VTAHRLGRPWLPPHRARSHEHFQSDLNISRLINERNIIMKKEILTRPFAADKIKQRPGQHGKTLSYVDISAVIERLNEAFDHRWDFEVVSHQVRDTEVVVLGKITADGVTKAAFGGSSITLDKEGEIASLADDLKAAGSDALKKAASLLGVGLEMYGGQPAEQKPGNGHAMPVGDRLTSKQLATIHGVARREGVTRDELLGLVAGKTGKDRVELLTRAEASNIIDALAAQGGNGAHP
jgi:hypothetical protein